MKKIILGVALGLATIGNIQASTLFNDKPIISKDYNLTGFSGLKNYHVVRIQYTQGNTYSIKAEGSEKQIESLILEVKDGILVVRNDQKKKKNSNENQMLTLYITSPDMNSLENKGVLKFNADKLKTDNLHVSSSGVLDLMLYRFLVPKLLGR